MHGGAIEAHSAGPRQGAEFVVRLPLIAELAVPPESAVGDLKVDPTLPQSRKLLIIDDNIDAASSLAMLLRLKGHETRVAHDGPTAVAAAASYQPEVILLDIGMPGMDGYEVARRVRAGPNGESVLLIALTGWGQEEDRRRTAEAGFDHHIVKPPDADALAALLSSQ
jgi:CheY-like chemotaxis protein